MLLKLMLGLNITWMFFFSNVDKSRNFLVVEIIFPRVYLQILRVKFRFGIIFINHVVAIESWKYYVFDV